WFSPPVNNPENTFLGVSYRNGGYVNSHGLFVRTNGYGGYGSTNSQHWVFQGTGLADGNVFGTPDTIVGCETDGATFRWSNGLPVVNGLDQTPLNFKILALSPAATPSPLPHHATMGIYRNANGGMVFNAATVN